MHGCRWWNIRNLDRYIGMIGEGVSPGAGSEQLSDRDVLTERVFLGLRSGGLDLADGSGKFGSRPGRTAAACCLESSWRRDSSS